MVGRTSRAVLTFVGSWAELWQALCMATSGQRSGKRVRRRAEVEGEILRVAREHLASRGAAALSLRAIARDLGMVSSGIYRYVASRDDLLTRLIVDAYRSLADAVGQAHDAVDPTDFDRRWAAVGFALRDWALDRPHDFALIYGSPVPDYEAPAERTVEVGTAVLAVLLRLAHDIHQQPGTDRLPASETMAADAVLALDPMLAGPFFEGVSLDAVTLARALSAWTLLLGAVTSEVFGQLGPLPDAEALFRVNLSIAGSLVLEPPALSTGLCTPVFTA